MGRLLYGSLWVGVLSKWEVGRVCGVRTVQRQNKGSGHDTRCTWKTQEAMRMKG